MSHIVNITLRITGVEDDEMPELIEEMRAVQFSSMIERIHMDELTDDQIRDIHDNVEISICWARSEPLVDAPA